MTQKVTHLLDSALSVGPFLIMARYRTRKSDGTYYYKRRWPDDIRGTKPEFFRKSLGTKDELKSLIALAKVNAEFEAQVNALRKAKDSNVTDRATVREAEALLSFLGLSPGDAVAVKDDSPLPAEVSSERWQDYLHANNKTWDALRYDPDTEKYELIKALTPIQREAEQLLFNQKTSKTLYLSEAFKLYLKDDRATEGSKFTKTTMQAYKWAEEIIGDIPITSIKRDPHVNNLRDAMLAKDLTFSTIRRRLGTLSTVFLHAIDEYDLNIKNPFYKVKIRNAKKSEPAEEFTIEELKAISIACRETNDDIRHLIGMLLNLGARVGEIVGLRSTDIHITGSCSCGTLGLGVFGKTPLSQREMAVPHVVITKESRSLKNDNSIRIVPLVGSTLWAAKEALKTTKGNGWLFPRYIKNNKPPNGDSASATIIDWIRDITKRGQGTHSFRSTVQTRLKQHNVPPDALHAIGGWGPKTIPGGYGHYPLDTLAELMKPLEEI